MPKIKTNRGAAKRFKVTATGKIKRKKAFLNHILTKKKSKRKRALGKPTLVTKPDMSRVKKMIPYDI
jgi:large subunit ribosomal protein L35